MCDAHVKDFWMGDAGVKDFWMCNKGVKDFWTCSKGVKDFWTCNKGVKDFPACGSPCGDPVHLTACSNPRANRIAGERLRRVLTPAPKSLFPQSRTWFTRAAPTTRCSRTSGWRSPSCPTQPWRRGKGSRGPGGSFSPPPGTRPRGGGSRPPPSPPSPSWKTGATRPAGASKGGVSSQVRVASLAVASVSLLWPLRVALVCVYVCVCVCVNNRVIFNLKHALDGCVGCLCFQRVWTEVTSYLIIIIGGNNYEIFVKHEPLE